MMLQNIASENQLQPVPRHLRMVFNDSQHVQNVDTALTQIKRIYKNTKYEDFKPALCDCIKKLLESESTIYFKTSCDFLHKFLKHLSKLSDNAKNNPTTAENEQPATPTKGKSKKDSRPVAPNARGAGGKRGKGGRRREPSSDESEDELISKSVLQNSRLSGRHSTYLDDEDVDEISIVSEMGTSKRKSTVLITDHKVTVHDQLISDCIYVVVTYAEAADDTCRMNALFFMTKFLSDANFVDESICDELKQTLSKRIRDKKPMVRAQAVIASQSFQDNRFIRDGFMHHFIRDPELVVRKALARVMKVEFFGHRFLIDSTLDTNETIRKTAFTRLSHIDPRTLSQRELHQVLHNGFVERERHATYAFKNSTLHSWLPKLYDGLDLSKLLETMDVIEYHDDIQKLLKHIYTKDSLNLQDNGTTTQLHKVVEHFREQWLTDTRIMDLSNDNVNEKIVVIWLSLIEFCRDNSSKIKAVKLRTVRSSDKQADESIEKILESQERGDEEVVDLYERLMPDLVHLIDFISRFVRHSDGVVRVDKSNANTVIKLEFMYHQLMKFSICYEIGDEAERKTVQETFDTILKQDLLTSKFGSFIPPIIKSLYHLVYSKSSKLMMNYIAEMIHNVRSHLEDIASGPVKQTPRHSIKRPSTNLVHSTIKGPAPKMPKSLKKVRIQDANESFEYENCNVDRKLADVRLEIELLNDELDSHVSKKEYDKAKVVHEKLEQLKATLSELQNRRSSNVSDISRMSAVIGYEQDMNDKLHSTMITPADLDDSNQSSHSHSSKHEEGNLFRYHPSELIKCLQMYFGCLQSVKVDQLPETMVNHLNYLNLECLNDNFKNNAKIRTLMVECNALTAYLSREFAVNPRTMDLFDESIYNAQSVDLRTSGFKSLVDVVCQHNVKFNVERVEKFLNNRLHKYGKYNAETMNRSETNFAIALIEGTTKLFYFKKIFAPEVFAHLVIWWYYPYTPSKLKQFIGIFLPTFVNDTSSGRVKCNNERDEDYLKDLLPEAFVLSINFLHNFIGNEGKNIMDSRDIQSLTLFLCNLVPRNMIQAIQERIDLEIDDSRIADLVKYYKQAKNSLSTLAAAIDTDNMQPNESQLIARPLNLFD